MNDAKALVREWMDLTAIGPATGWQGRASADLVVLLPYAPPGVVPEMRGFDQALEILSHHWAGKRSFDWHDVVIRQTEDPEPFLTTARSEVVFDSGQTYANSYVMLTRVRDGKVVEHTEYFNPLPIVEMFAKRG
jgi:ketosteroid isomerase-like protein